MSKYNRTYHIKISKGSTSDDRFQYDLSSILGKSIVISEKLDGENNCITNTAVFSRSHAAPTTNPWTTKVWDIQKIIKHSLNGGVYLYGEGLQGIHSIEYKNLSSYFYLFAVKDEDKWLSWQEVEDYSYLLDIPTVPILFKGIINTEEELNTLVLKLVSQESKLGGEMEGCVIRVADSFDNSEFSKSVLKWVRQSHVKTDKHWSKSFKTAKLVGY